MTYVEKILGIVRMAERLWGAIKRNQERISSVISACIVSLFLVSSWAVGSHFSSVLAVPIFLGVPLGVVLCLLGVGVAFLALYGVRLLYSLVKQGLDQLLR